MVDSGSTDATRAVAAAAAAQAGQEGQRGDTQAAEQQPAARGLKRDRAVHHIGEGKVTARVRDAVVVKQVAGQMALRWLKEFRGSLWPMCE